MSFLRTLELNRLNDFALRIFLLPHLGQLQAAPADPKMAIACDTLPQSQ